MEWRGGESRGNVAAAAAAADEEGGNDKDDDKEARFKMERVTEDGDDNRAFNGAVLVLVGASSLNSGFSGVFAFAVALRLFGEMGDKREE